MNYDGMGWDVLPCPESALLYCMPFWGVCWSVLLARLVSIMCHDLHFISSDLVFHFLTLCSAIQSLHHHAIPASSLRDVKSIRPGNTTPCISFFSIILLLRFGIMTLNLVIHVA